MRFFRPGKHHEYVVVMTFVFLIITSIFSEKLSAEGMTTMSFSPQLAYQMSYNCPNCGAKLIEQTAASDGQESPIPLYYCSKDKACGLEFRNCKKCGKKQSRYLLSFDKDPKDFLKYIVKRRPGSWSAAGCTCSSIDQGEASAAKSNLTAVDPDDRSTKSVPQKGGQQKTVASAKQSRHPNDPLPIEEPEEFWSPEEKEVIENVVGGIAVLGGAGLGLYAILSGLGLIGAKTGAGAIATAGVAATASTSASATAAVSGASAGVGAAEAAIPKVGDARSYLDEQGTRWVEVFDGHNWVDSATNSANQTQIADNQAWQQREFDRQISGDNAFNREVQAKAQARAEAFSAKHEATRNEIRNISKFLQEMAEGDRKNAEIALQGKERALAYMEATKTVIDCVALPLVGATLGPAATLVSGGYSVVGEAVAGATEGFINADSITKGVVNAVKGGLKGAAQGAVSVVVSEGLNAMASVGSTVIRTIRSNTPLKVLHNDSSGTELVKKLWGNFKGGKGLTHGLVKTPPQIPPQLKIRMNRFNAPRIEKRAWEISNIKDAIKAEHTQDLIWGTASSCKSYFIDGSVTQNVNSTIFAS